MTNIELDQQKNIIPVFEELYLEHDKISHHVSGLGWKQRNELVTHVYSGYNNHEKLNAAKTLWEKTHTQMNVLKWLCDLFIKHRDLYGYFTDYKGLIEEMEGIIDQAIIMERYEIADTLTMWRNKLPNP